MTMCCSEAVVTDAADVAKVDESTSNKLTIVSTSKQISTADELVTTNNDSSGASFRSILKSTSLIGGSSILNILIGMVRTKFVAILLGPNGIGLFAMYSQITTLVGTITGMGIGTSGVRQVAEAVGANDEEKIARSVVTLRRASWLTGGFGLLTMIVLCVPISLVTFKSSEYSLPIAFLGVTLLLTSITAAQSCVLRGTRRIANLAKINVISALCGTMVSIPCFYLFGIRGVVVSLIFNALAVLVTSWWYARQVSIMPIVMSWRESGQEALSLFSLGFSFMGASLLGNGTSYFTQTFLIRQFSLADAGIYQAAYGLSGVLVGFVLGAMGTDYYPRLTAIASDNANVRKIVNEQSQISILLALPGLAAMMIFAPLIIQIFYSSSFAPALPLLRWFVIGMFGRIVSWPLGFVLMAKGMGKVFFATEAILCGFNITILVFFTGIWGLDGAGIAFMVANALYTLIILAVISRLIGMAWDRQTAKLVVLSVAILTTLALSNSINSELVFLWTINSLILCAVSWFCLKQLLQKSNCKVIKIFSRQN